MSESAVTVDYLVIGAGATGLAFADALVTESSYTVAIVDRYDAPGGHWTLSYPFVRLHGAASVYGVHSLPMPSDGNDIAVASSLASRHEILEYFGEVMEEVLLASGRVTYLPNHELGQTDEGPPIAAVARHRLSGVTTRINVRRRVVDSAYTDLTVPAMAQRGFTADAEVELIPINGLATLAAPPSRTTVIGAGKTGIDACVWLLSRGIDPSRVTWVIPREPWLLSRDSRDGSSQGISGLLGLREAQSTDEALELLEAWEIALRRDPDVTPTAFRCASVNWEELGYLRQIENVVTLGRVRHIGAAEVELEDGSVAAQPGTLYVDCSADGLRQRPPRPVFERNRITIQPLVQCLLSISAAVTGRLEALDLDDEVRNDLCRPVPHPREPADLLEFFRCRIDCLLRWTDADVLRSWLVDSRLSPSLPGLDQDVTDPALREALGELAVHLQSLRAVDSEPTRAGV